MLSYFLYNSMHSKMGEPSLNGLPDKEILVNVSIYCDQQSEKILEAF